MILVFTVRGIKKRNRRNRMSIIFLIKKMRLTKNLNQEQILTSMIIRSDQTSLHLPGLLYLVNQLNLNQRVNKKLQNKPLSK